MFAYHCEEHLNSSGEDLSPFRDALSSKLSYGWPSIARQKPETR
jgi:hypothetical protein